MIGQSFLSRSIYFASNAANSFVRKIDLHEGFFILRMIGNTTPSPSEQKSFVPPQSITPCTTVCNNAPQTFLVLGSQAKPIDLGPILRAFSARKHPAYEL